MSNAWLPTSKASSSGNSGASAEMHPPLDEVVPDPFRLCLFRGSHHLLQHFAASREPQFRTARMQAEVAEVHLDHDVDSLGRCLCPRGVEDGADESIEFARVLLQEFGVDLVAIGEVVVKGAVGMSACSPMA
ncbi:hypothetical protein [Streptomyces hydrogenans]